MQTIAKSQVSNWLLLESFNKKRHFEEQINLFSKKYQITFEQFEKQVNSSEKENDEHWDDYIDWKAYTEFLSSTLKSIEDIKHGNFKVI